MIHNDVLTQLQLLIKTSAPPLLEVSQQPLGAPQWVPGQQVQAHVLANLPNGRFQVQIGDQKLDMNLPKSTQPGESIELTFVTQQPRLTFVLSRDLAASSSAPAQTPVTLSSTARFLGALLEKAAQHEAGSQAAPLARTAPLLAGAPDSVPVLAQALRSAVTQSGLFYESHQAQWVNGQRPLSDLLKEPQARLSPTLAGHSQALPPVSPKAEEVGVASARQQAIASDGASVARPASPEQPAHPDTVPLVRQQLEALDTHQVVWQGQVWPGQAMEWRIGERDAREHDPGAPPEWQTRLNLALPRLGDVAAMLALGPQGFRIRLEANDAATEGLMRDNLGGLQNAFEAAGLRLAELAVKHGEA